MPIIALAKILNTLLLSIVFLALRLVATNLTNQIYDANRSSALIMRAKSDFLTLLWTAICITLMLLLLCEIVGRVLKNRKIGLQALITGLIPAVVLFLFMTIYARNKDPLVNFISICPFLITGILFPLTEFPIYRLLGGRQSCN